MSKNMLEIFPEIGWIESPELRQKVIDTFEDGLSNGTWTYDSFYTIPFTVTYPVIITYRDHVRGVTQMALALYDKYRELYPDPRTLNRDHVIASALLHDVGKLLEITVDESGKAVKSANGKLLRHAFTGVALAMRHDIPDEITHVVAVHSTEGDASKRTPIALLIQHSDHLNEFFSKIEV